MDKLLEGKKPTAPPHPIKCTKMFIIINIYGIKYNNNVFILNKDI